MEATLYKRPWVLLFILLPVAHEQQLHVDSGEQHKPHLRESSLSSGKIWQQPIKTLIQCSNRAPSFSCFVILGAGWMADSLASSHICPDLPLICCRWVVPSASWFHPCLCPTWAMWSSWGTTSDSCSTSPPGWPPPCSSSWLWVRRADGPSSRCCGAVQTREVCFSSSCCVCLCSV